MKEYNKLMKDVARNEDFTIVKNGNKPTIKVVYDATGELYSVHPGDNAVKPLKKWMQNIKKK